MGPGAAARGGTPDPALVFSLRWLRDHIPPYDGPPVLVQGDTGPGNFMYLGGRVTAVVDWELAHLGDPMDDIAWLSLRATQEPFTDFPTRLREYEALSGNVIDEDRVRYYQVMAETKLQVMSHRGPQAMTTKPRAAADGTVAATTSATDSSTRSSIGGLWLEALGRRQRPGTDPRREAPGPGPPRQRLDVRRRAHPAPRRHRPPYDGPAGAGTRERGRPHHQVPGPGRHLRSLLRGVRAAGPGEAARAAPRLGGDRAGGRCGGGRGGNRRRRRTTSSRCGAGSPARPSWPVRPWACSPTGTGRRSDETAPT